MIEKRKYVRINSEIGIQFHLKEDNKKIYGFKSKNISMGGLLLIYDEDIPLNTDLDIEIEIQGSELPPAIIKSRVAHRMKLAEDRYGIGIEFMEISEEMITAIGQYIRKNINQEPFSEDEKRLLHQYSQKVDKKQ